MKTLLFLIVMTTSTLVLRSGDRIVVDGPVNEKDGVVTFKSGGLLYSMPIEEIDVEATQSTTAEEPEDSDSDLDAVLSDEETLAARKLRVSQEERQRLLRELEKNHEGTPAPAEQLRPAPAAEPSKEEVRDDKSEEMLWRDRAADAREAVLHAEEEPALLLKREAELDQQIQNFLFLGYKPSQFTYQTTQLEITRNQIPRARLDVQQAKREQQTFWDNAEKVGIPAAWVR